MQQQRFVERCYKLRVFDNEVLKRIFGPTRHQVPREWRNLYKEDFEILYFSTDVIS